MRLLGAIMVVIVVAGCAANVDRYTWSGPAGFGQNRHECIIEANSAYIPWVAGNGPRLTLYKDCMERRGYVKAN
jgi:hypothetical protein